REVLGITGSDTGGPRRYDAAPRHGADRSTSFGRTRSTSPMTGPRSSAAPPRRPAASAARADVVPGGPAPSRERPLWPTWVGPAALVTIAVGYLALWIAARPSGEPTGRFVGELSGAEAVLLMCCSLVLATLLPFIERAFGGLDRVAVWHRRAAVVGFLLLVPH